MKSSVEHNLVLEYRKAIEEIIKLKQEIVDLQILKNKNEELCKEIEDMKFNAILKSGRKFYQVFDKKENRWKYYQTMNDIKEEYGICYSIIHQMSKGEEVKKYDYLTIECKSK